MNRDYPPTHLHDPDTPTTRCGIPIYTRRKDWLPLCATRWAQTHIDAYGMKVCPRCAQGAGLRPRRRRLTIIDGGAT